MSPGINPGQAAAEIARHLQRITHQHFFRSFDDWLALAVSAFLSDEAAYMDIMGRYGPRQAPIGQQDHPADHFARALGAWLRAMQAEPADYLGRVYEEQAVANSYAGQFFTPEPVVELMARITMPDDIPDTAVVHDPACGSGRMLIAGIRRNRFATFVGVDTDLTCVHMTALNCLVRNANSYILHGNSLSLEAWGGFFVRRSPFGGEIFRLSQEQAATLMKLPLSSRAEASTALETPMPVDQGLSVADPATETRQTIDAVSREFGPNRKGQFDFGF